MFKIGDFSRIAHVSIKTLRHYALEGLLEPVWIDRFTGYRYYSLEQLPRLNRVLALKDLGFSLEQIKHLMDDGLSAVELRGMLLLKKTELQQRVQEEQLRLVRVEKRLEQIETEGVTSGHEMLLKPIPSTLVAWARTHAATLEQADAAREGLRQLILTWCLTYHIRMIGPWFSLLENDSFNDSRVDIHLGVAVEEGSSVRRKLASSPVHLSRIQSIPLAACLLGDRKGHAPHSELLSWIELNGYRSCGETCLVYLGETPETSLAERIIEIQVPIKSENEVAGTSQNQKEIGMEPVKFETLPAFKVMGMKYRGKNEHDEISEMWGQVNQRAHEIPLIGPCAFGVCLMVSNAPEGVFEYIAGFKVASDAVAPKGMVTVDVPESKYAVFEHLGAKETLMNTYNLIANEWFPRSGQQPQGGFDMELYDDKFKDFKPDSIMYIYEPVK